MSVKESGSVLKVSVVIPAYQAEGTICRSLLSVANQTYSPSEVIVIDDGSTDNTFDKAVSMGTKFDRSELKVYKQANMGPGIARNYGVAEATGEFIAFLDADDEWVPNKIERSMIYLSSGKYVLICHNGWVHRSNSREYLDIAKRFRGAKPSLFQALYRRGFISTSSVVVRRSAMLEVGGFDETLAVGQDFDLWLKLAHKDPDSFWVFEEPLTNYYITAGSITSLVEKRLECTMDIAMRHAEFLANHKGSRIVSLLFRIVAVHLEAISTYKRRGQLMAIVWTIGRLHLRLLSSIKIIISAGKK